MNSKINISKIRRDGGNLCLDFINTVHDRTELPARDYLESYSDMIDWLELVKGFPIPAIDSLRKIAQEHPNEASQVFTSLIQIREMLFGIFSALAHAKKPSGSNLATLNDLISETMNHMRVEFSQGKFKENWTSEITDLRSALWPITKSALELLLSGDFKRLKECPRCRWLFYDTSKNGKRRWCSMETCGSNDKALRYYYRNKR